MNDRDLREIAYAIEESYREKKTQGEAIEFVKDNFPDADLNILWAMWYAIDAYVDVNK